MVSHQFGALAVALGIGSAVVAGHGVASADTSDGPTTASTDKTTSTESTPSDNTNTETPKAAGDLDTEVKPKPKKGSKGARPSGSGTESIKPAHAAGEPES